MIQFNFICIAPLTVDIDIVWAPPIYLTFITYKMFLEPLVSVTHTKNSLCCCDLVQNKLFSWLSTAYQQTCQWKHGSKARQAAIQPDTTEVWKCPGACGRQSDHQAGVPTFTVGLSTFMNKMHHKFQEEKATRCEKCLNFISVTTDFLTCTKSKQKQDCHLFGQGGS